jgi:glyoxylate utilization-related uncharacterized protein
MKKVLREQSKVLKNSPICSVTEFPLNEKFMDFAIVQISGRYPEKGNVINTKCKEIAYVQNGRGEIVVNGERHAIQGGDLVLIEEGERYHWNGELSLSITCRPAWSKDQYQIVDDAI